MYLSSYFVSHDIDAEVWKKQKIHLTQQQVEMSRELPSSELQEVCGMLVRPHEVPKSRGLVQNVLPAVLIMHSHGTVSYRTIQRLCGYLRVKADLYHTQSSSGPFLYKTSKNNRDTSSRSGKQGKYAVIVVVGLQVLSEMSPSKLSTIFSYSKETSVPVVIVTTKEAQLKLPRLLVEGDNGSVFHKVWATLSSVNFTKTVDNLIGGKVSSAGIRILPKTLAPFLSVTKSASFSLAASSAQGLALMSSTHHAFVPVACLQVNSTASVSEAPLMLYDSGSVDGVAKVLVGLDIGQFPFPLLFYDIAVGLSPVPLIKFDPLKRFILIDVDDTFHAPTGRQPTVEHVEKVLKFQQSVRQSFIKNFHLNLGFVGSGFEKGTPEERKGSKLLVQRRDEFWWFPHTFRHVKCHSMDLDQLREEMRNNREFADKHGLSDLVRGYSVAPYHAGVYPVHLPLYHVWREVWNITVTTTEEYPALQPPFSRRGFEYEGLRVLPRQTCGIYTKQTYFKELSLSSLQSYARGGQVLQTILFNPISVFMTHYNNYGGDQLAILLFLEAFQFISKYTNLELVQEEPRRLSELYFQWYPEQRLPVWTSPCLYQRHREIWSEKKNCSRLPSLLIVGPQKTGSTAIHFFLQAHPSVRTNKPTEHFEEVQFFSSDDVYQKGINWYMELFPYPVSADGNALLLFEKSATYFESRLAARRASALLPGANIVVILDDPIRRAYSWYQVRAVRLLCVEGNGGVCVCCVWLSMCGGEWGSMCLCVLYMAYCVWRGMGEYMCVVYGLVCVEGNGGVCVCCVWLTVCGGEWGSMCVLCMA